jgi:extracellular elastinolytic metalloproteinase
VTSENPLELSLNFVRQVVGDNVQYVVKSEYTTKHNNVHHAYLRQTLNGLEIFNADLNINTWKKEVLSVGHSFYFGKQPAKVGVKSATEAAAAFAKYLGIEVAHSSLAVLPGAKKAQQIIKGFPNVNEVKAAIGYIINEGGNSVEAVWELEVELNTNWWCAHVSAIDLRVIALHDWVNELNTYEVFPIGVTDPSDGERTLVSNPAKRSSPNGWNDQGNGRTFTDTQGNNVYAQENLSGSTSTTTWVNNQRPKGGETLDFVFPVDFTQNPKTYINASTTNLFFWNNIIHDIFYEYGFDEVSGNFQENNLGKGGLGGDAVQANSQDGAGVNNANFATPPDGQRPKMRMYVWTNSVPSRDGDFDQGIIIHEYAHGISNRLTGGPSNVNCLGSGEAGGMGEGWGDFFATVLRQRSNYHRNMSFPMGPYSANNPKGIRKFPYSTNLTVDPETYDYVNRAGYEGVHAKGEVWAGILLEAYWNYRDALGFNEDWYIGEGGNNKILQDVIDGMKLQPCRPNFVQARDAILQADKVNSDGKNLCLLWRAFAKRGLGLYAVGTTTGVTKVVEDFSLPENCKQ